MVFQVKDLMVALEPARIACPTASADTNCPTASAPWLLTCPGQSYPGGTRGCPRPSRFDAPAATEDGLSVLRRQLAESSASVH